LEQRIRFCTATDGIQLAYAEHGSGPPLVRAGHWLTHLEFDWESPIWRHWLRELARGHTVVRYDQRGCGLSDRDTTRLSLDVLVGDLEAVIDASGHERFALLGVSGGGPVAISYTVRHPERVTHLVLYGAYARGRWKRNPSDQQREEARLLQSLIRVGWGRDDPIFRRVFTTLYMPGASREQMDWFEELQRASAAPEDAERLRESWSHLDVTELLPVVTTPTLVAHARDESAVPFAEGRLLAARIPGARFVPLQGRNHILLPDEPAWPEFLAAMREFLGTQEAPAADDLEDLSAREREVLELVAAGLSNEEIGERLFVSVRTVERHLSNVYAKLRISGKAARAAAAARFSALRR
jgi:pimeloyl-ACP methyl ester carboxylesterase/DNA-binding CsgD family transcriptional regulator